MSPNHSNQGFDLLGVLFFHGTEFRTLPVIHFPASIAPFTPSWTTFFLQNVRSLAEFAFELSRLDIPFFGEDPADSLCLSLVSRESFVPGLT